MNTQLTSPANVLPGIPVLGFSERSTTLEVTPDLAARINGGDEAALEILLRSYLPALRRIVQKQLRGHARSMLDAEDVVQDALVSTLRRMPHFVWRTPGAMLAYLRRVVLNRIIDANRKCARQGEWVPLTDDCAGETPSPLERVVDSERIRRYRTALLRLKPRDRQLIVLRVERQLRYQEIGTQLRMPSANAARVALIRAMARLVTTLDQV